ncbi:MAG: pilin [Candidatus Taylorbacteria bacterium]
MKKFITVLAVLAPSIAMADTIVNADNLVFTLTRLGNVLIGLLIAAAVIFIIWHAVMFIFKASDPEGRSAHRTGVLWGIVGLAIILSIWGLVGILTNTFSTTNNPNQVGTPPVIPTYAPNIQNSRATYSY